MRTLAALLLVVILLSTGAFAQAPQAPAQRAVALTFDDLPKAAGGGAPGQLASMRASTARLLATVKAHHAPAIGFVNERKVLVPGEIDARRAVLAMWLEAGFELGNHTFSHPSFIKTPVWQFQDEVIRGEPITRQLMENRGLRLRYFRHPMLHTGPTKEARQQFEAFLTQHGYTVAPVTIDNADYIFNLVYVDARRKGDPALVKRVTAAYLEHMMLMTGYFEALSRELFGREIKQVLLLHANDINADHLGTLLTSLERRGYRFIALDEALADPAYQTPDEYIGPMGISWLHRWKLAKGRPLNYESEPDPPKWVLDLYKEAQAR